jgi:ubiquitin C-terminal hydrolase
MQLLYAVPEFRENILKSTSRNSFISGVREIFQGLGMSARIGNNRLGRLFNEKIIPETGGRVGEQRDAQEFMLLVLDKLTSGDAQIYKPFQFKMHDIVHAKDNPRNKNEKIAPENMLRLPIKPQPERKEIPGEFMQAFKDWSAREELTGDNQWEGQDGKKVDAIKHIQISNPPPYLLIQIIRYYNEMVNKIEITKKNDRPMSIPLEFTLPEGIMVNPKPAKYKLVGGIWHSGTLENGHYIAYIKNPNGFWEFNDDVVSRMSNDRALAELKTGAYIVAYRREN